MYHKSKYNYIYKKNKNSWIIYNTFSGSILMLDKENYNNYNNLNDYNIENKDEFVNSLITQGVLIDNKYDEKKMLDASRARRTYNEKSAYIRILTTTVCNARCSYCYEKGYIKNTMSEETALAVVDFIKRMPKLEKIYIHWFGGEPLINTKVIDIISNNLFSYLEQNDTEIFVYFTSNGSLLDKTIVKKAKKEWKATSFQITIDDLNENYDKIKNYINKKYNYQNVINNIELLLEEDIKVIVRINYLPQEVDKVKRVIEELSKKFLIYIKNGKLIFDPAPIFNMNSQSCSNCNKIYNISEPIKYLLDNNLTSEKLAYNLDFKGGQCYACHQGSFVISPLGDLYKCTTTMNDTNAIVGNVFSGIDRNIYYYKWVNPNLPVKCNKCIFLPLCQGGCRAGEFGYLDVHCKRNLSEIKDIVNHKIDKNILKMSKLVDFKDSINDELHKMYDDIPPKELGSTNILYKLSYEEFYNKCLEMVKEENEINLNLNTTTKRFILKVNDNFIGEIGIRTTLNDFWKNKGSQIYYKIRKSERGKGYGNIILKLALEKAKDLGFDKVRINCNNKNLPSKKIILKNGGIADIKNYKTAEGVSTSYLIYLDE